MIMTSPLPSKHTSLPPTLKFSFTPTKGLDQMLNISGANEVMKSFKQEDKVD